MRPARFMGDRRNLRLLSAALWAAVVPALVAAGTSPSSSSTSLLAVAPGVANHPVGIVPSDAVFIPEGWPLDERGAITCLTCHRDVPVAGEPWAPKLRDVDAPGAEPTDFCAKCHRRPSATMNAKSLHWLALGVAHIPDERADRPSGSEHLDARTRACLSCHDGVIASESKNGTPWNRTEMSLGDPRRNHPVGIPYNDVARPKDLSPLRPAGLLPPDVALPEGKVTCVSCHNLYARTRYRLTVPIQGSELCLTCHDMR